jgi:mycofactocin precursor
MTDPQGTAPQKAAQETDEDLVEDSSLIEEISIDGMCGVY